jgi:lipoprotein-releasing system permease protein
VRRLEFAIAWRYLRSRRGSRLLSMISVIAIGGVVVGVSALILIMGVMNGLQRDLREKILIGSPDIRILAYGDMRIDDWDRELTRVRGIPSVAAAAPFTLTEGVIRNVNQVYNEGVYVAGIPAEDSGEPAVTQIRSLKKEGDFRFRGGDGQRNGIVLGTFLAQRLAVGLGDSIEVATLGGTKINAVTGAPVPSIERLEVTGTFETGMYEYDNKYAYVDLSLGQRLAGLGSAVTGIEVRTATREEAGRVAAAIDSVLPFHLRTVDWQEQNQNLFQALKLEKLGMGVILGLIIIVAAFNIVSTLTMVVSDKTREIGILKAMGMTAPRIRRIFLAQGLVIGFVGTSLGLVLGLLASWAVGEGRLIRLDPAVYFIEYLPVALQPLDVLAILVSSILIAMLATLYPSQQAARLYPVEAIRHE